ncbi:MAG: UvrD-helicase domain-containing protein [Candidatus Cloacimonetes bacterium]|nr:UvrD-helicase domain-containing protein [Candidatus Cloacimonadota bacterium]
MIRWEELNPQQREVVRHTEGPVLALAGAGSGKTRSIIYRAAYLLNEKRVEPQRLLIVTFTNKAARELRSRLRHSFGLDTHSMWVGTFHGVCSRILRAESRHTGFESNFVIYDQDDQRALLKKVFKELDIDTERFQLGAAHQIISQQKSTLIRPADFFEFQKHTAATDTMAQVYDLYQKKLRQNNAMDFDDLLMHTAFLLHDNEDVRQWYAGQFRYVMIDEYQDTNYAQFKIVHLLAAEHRNLCVVGDDDQAIYSWRGATIKNILNFHKDYKGVAVYRLEENYRSTGHILNLAHSLITHNSGRHDKKLWTNLGDGEMPRLDVFERERDEARAVADAIGELQFTASLDEIVVLYRTNAQSRTLEAEMVKRGVPYAVVGGVNFFRRREVKDAIAYLRVLVNPDDSESLLRIINVPSRKIGATTIGRLLDFALRQSVNLYRAVMRSEENEALGKAAAKSVGAFADDMNRWNDMAANTPVPQLLMTLLDESGLLGRFEKSVDPQDEARAENLRELINAAAEFDEQHHESTGNHALVRDWLQDIALLTDLDTVDENKPTVKLMTMHNAKGLEFDHVFVVGLSDGLVPHRLNSEETDKLEEERRLLYVAMTRACRQLRLSYSHWRRDRDTIVHTDPSRFIAEFDSRYIEMDQAARYTAGEVGRGASGAFAAGYRKHRGRKQALRGDVTLESHKRWRIGARVRHKSFGEGVVLNVDGDGLDARLTVSFSGGQMKRIVGSFVKLVT